MADRRKPEDTGIVASSDNDGGWESEDSCSEYESAESDADTAAARPLPSDVPPPSAPLSDKSGDVGSSAQVQVPSSSSGRHRIANRPLARLRLPPEELELPGGYGGDMFVPMHPGLPAAPSALVSPEERVRLAAMEGQLPRTANVGVITPPHKPDDLMSGVYYNAQYLGSTFIFVADTSKGNVLAKKAREAISIIKQPDGERQPRFAVTFKITCEFLSIINQMSDVELMSFHLCTVLYVTDINDLLVVMVRKHLSGDEEQTAETKISCHVLQIPQARNVALAVGQAFNVSYHQFLRNSGVKETALQEVEYASVLCAQQSPSSEVTPLVNGSTKQVVIGKRRREMLGMMVVRAGIGSTIPTAIIAHLAKNGPAFKSGQLNIGDYLLSVNGSSLVGLPIHQSIQHIKDARNDQLVKLMVLSMSPVLEVTILRPDTKFPLGFSVKEGVVCDLVRGSMADRSGVRVGYRIIQVGTYSTIKESHEHIVHLLQTAVGQIQLKMMHLLVYEVMVGEVVPIHF